MTEESEDKDDNNNDKRIVESEAAVEIGATIIKDVERFVSSFLLTVLQAVIKEQVRSKQLKRKVGDYIYQAVKDQVIRKGWIS